MRSTEPGKIAGNSFNRVSCSGSQTILGAVAASLLSLTFCQMSVRNIDKRPAEGHSAPSVTSWNVDAWLANTFHAIAGNRYGVFT